MSDELKKKSFVHYELFIHNGYLKKTGIQYEAVRLDDALSALADKKAEIENLKICNAVNDAALRHELDKNATLTVENDALKEALGRILKSDYCTLEHKWRMVGFTTCVYCIALQSAAKTLASCESAEGENDVCENCKARVAIFNMDYSAFEDVNVCKKCAKELSGNKPSEKGGV